MGSVESSGATNTNPPSSAAAASAPAAAGEMAAVLSPLENAKRVAAVRAVDEHVRDGFVVGVGSGSTVVYVVQRLVERVREEKLQIVCVASSFQATQLIVDGGLTLSDLSRHPVVDVTIDGADEVAADLALLKGGGAAHTQEKVLAKSTKKFVVVADYRKDSHTLGSKWRKGVPVEVIPSAWVPVKRWLEHEGAKAVVLRMAESAKAGPVVTDNGNFVLDSDFGEIHNPGKLEERINSLPGVLDCGLFVGLAAAAYFGYEDGTVKHRTA